MRMKPFLQSGIRRFLIGSKQALAIAIIINFGYNVRGNCKVMMSQAKTK